MPRGSSGAGGSGTGSPFVIEHDDESVLDNDLVEADDDGELIHA